VALMAEAVAIALLWLTGYLVGFATGTINEKTKQVAEDVLGLKAETERLRALTARIDGTACDG
jgi:hypothetical protein